MAQIDIRENTGLPKGSDEFVESFARGLAVIRAFGSGPRALTMSEIAERANIAPAGARRLLHTLVTLGYARMEGKRFALSPLILELGFSYLSSRSLGEVARSIIAEFARETGEVCTVTVLDGQDVVYVVRAEVRSPLARSLGVGDRMPVHATSSGHILLSGLESDALAAILDRAPFQRFTARTRCTRHELLDAVNFARENGWAVASEELELGVCAIAVPIRDEIGAITAALTISVNLARYDQNTIQEVFLRRLTETARQITLGRSCIP